MVIDGAGRVIVAGSISEPDGGLLRFLPDGRHDTSYGANGLVRLPWLVQNVAAYKDGTTVTAHRSLTALDADGGIMKDLAMPKGVLIESLRIDSSNRLLVAGATMFRERSAFAVLRFKADFTPDNNFGTAGMVISTFPQGPAHIADAALTPGGDLIASGSVTSFVGSPSNGLLNSLYGWVRYDLDAGPAFGFPAQRNDFNSDGNADVLARDRSGVLWLYPGNGRGGFLTHMRIGGGWNVMTAIVGSDDLNTDGKADAVARDSSGVLWFYPGNGNGAFGTRVRIGAGWERHDGHRGRAL